MKMMKKIKYLIGVVVLVMMAGACTENFEEINTNPNGPAEVTPDLLLPAAIEMAVDRMNGSFVGHDMSCWAQQMAKIQYTDEDRYIYRTSVVNSTWNGLYIEGLTDAKDIEAIAAAMEEPNVNYQGIAKIWQAYIYSNLTDIYGDIPFSGCNKGYYGSCSSS